MHSLKSRGLLKLGNPLLMPVAAVSCGIVDSQARLDLDYEEDSAAEVDANIIMTADGNIVELQMSGEEATFSEAQLAELMALGRKGIAELAAMQRKVLA
ncbi:MAG: hypothetical protein WDN72_07285 [Alphaproteobacteria bacterium]